MCSNLQPFILQPTQFTDMEFSESSGLTFICHYMPGRGTAERGVCAKYSLAAAEAAGGRSSLWSGLFIPVPLQSRRRKLLSGQQGEFDVLVVNIFSSLDSEYRRRNSKGLSKGMLECLESNSSELLSYILSYILAWTASKQVCG